MVLIVDSGSTKTDWIAVDAKGEHPIFNTDFRAKSSGPLKRDS